MIKFNLWLRVSGVILLWAVAAVALPAQKTAGAPPAPMFTTIYSFDNTDGSSPQGLVQGTDGNFYGTTTVGGANWSCNYGCGTVFKVNPSGIGPLTSLHSFDKTDGANPYAGLVQGTDGNLYGTTYTGGANNVCGEYNNQGCGTVFKITPSGKLTTLHNFNGTDGSYPEAGLAQGADGNFYGTTNEGGLHCAPYGCGTIFKITASGTLTTLHSFGGRDGDYPFAALVQGADGNFYGTTDQGGANNSNGGTIFKITPNGKLTTLHSFDITDGASPVAGLVQATNGNFYGTTFSGGAGTACKSDTGCGTVFKITPNGKLTMLYSFCSQRHCTDGYEPLARLAQATNGNFYGTTYTGGANDNCNGYGCGTVFKITPNGKLTTLHSFDGTDGSWVGQPLVQDTNGKFYGTASGGANNYGTVFSLSVGLK
jgi:uncharacterized repeat protein (TIGR03803 family)